MRLITPILVCIALSACERYTEKTSPCFGNTGKSVVSKAASASLDAPVAAFPNLKDCTFTPVTSG